LTLLGIVIGVTSVIAVAAIIDGLNLFVAQKVEQFGPRSWFVSRFPFGTDPNRVPERIRTRRYLQYSDSEKLREYAPLAEHIIIMGTRASFFG
jgi:ABC-type antimicrobial peptide transport system permease subunit